MSVLSLVPVIKNTIGRHTSRVVYYSETVDSSIPTEDTGVPNTESGKILLWMSPPLLSPVIFLYVIAFTKKFSSTGHCAKLWAIMRNSKVNKKASGKKWLVVVDDDTILRSVGRLVCLFV